MVEHTGFEPVIVSAPIPKSAHFTGFSRTALFESPPAVDKFCPRFCPKQKKTTSGAGEVVHLFGSIYIGV